MANFKGQFSSAVYNAYCMATRTNEVNYDQVVTGVTESLASQIPADYLGNHDQNGHLFVTEKLVPHLMSVIDIARMEGKNNPMFFQCQNMATINFFEAAALAINPEKHPVDYYEINLMLATSISAPKVS